jgi:hypothetical protein
MIELEAVVHDRLESLRAAAAARRHERRAAALDGRLGFRARLRLRLGRHLVAIGTWLLQGSTSHRGAAIAR